MKRPKVFAWLFTVVLLGIDLHAQSRFTFDLDVPAARFSFWKLEDLGLFTRLDSELELRELRRDSRWIASFQVVLAGPDNREFAVVFVRDGDANAVTVKAEARQKESGKGQREIAGWRIRKGERFTLGLDWSDSGSVAVFGNGKELGRFHIDFAPLKMAVLASTCELVGHSLSLSGPRSAK